jgi:hypothetical protein
MPLGRRGDQLGGDANPAAIPFDRAFQNGIDIQFARDLGDGLLRRDI